MGPVSFLPNLKIIRSQKTARLLPKANGIHCEIATANSDVKGSNCSGLRIRRPLQGDTCRAGLFWVDWEKTELLESWQVNVFVCKHRYVCTHTHACTHKLTHTNTFTSIFIEG